MDILEDPCYTKTKLRQRTKTVRELKQKKKGLMSVKKRILAIAAALAVFTVTAAAATYGVQRTIDVTGGVSVFMDGNELEMQDVNGNPVDAFVYDGTTYLPARAISEANGKTVAWDGETGRVDITSETTASSNPNAARLINQEDRYFIFDLSENVTRTEGYLSKQVRHRACGRPVCIKGFGYDAEIPGDCDRPSLRRRERTGPRCLCQRTCAARICGVGV